MSKTMIIAFLVICVCSANAGEPDDNEKAKPQRQEKTEKHGIEQVLLEDAKAAEKKGDLGLAIKIYDRILKDHPKSPVVPEVHYRYGNALSQKKNRLEDRLAHYRKAVELVPRSRMGKDALKALTIALICNGRKAEAEKHERKLASLDPGYAQDVNRFRKTMSKAMKLFHENERRFKEGEGKKVRVRPVVAESQYYLDGQFAKTNNSTAIRVNGFPVFQQSLGSSESVSSWLSPYLKNGRNTITIFFSPRSSNSYGEVFIRASEGGRREPEDEPVILKHEFEPDEAMLDLKNMITGIKGKGGYVSLASQKEGRCLGAWSLEPKAWLATMPTSIVIELSTPVKRAKLRFINSTTKRTVEFAFASGLPKQLSPEMVTSGKDWLSGTFDSVQLECSSRNSGTVTVKKFRIGPLPETLRKTFEVKIPDPCWIAGADVEKALKQNGGRAKAIAQAKRIYGAFVAGWPSGSYGKFARLKIKDEAVLRNISPKDHLARLEQLNQGAFKKYEWVPAPFTEKTLRLVAVNAHVLSMVMSSGEPVLQMKARSSRPGTFSLSLPLYLAYINGNWEWVR